MKCVNHCPFRIKITRALEVSRWGTKKQFKESSIPSRFNNENVSIFVKSGGGYITGKYLPSQLYYDRDFDDFEEMDRMNNYIDPIIIPVTSLYDAILNTYIFVCDIKILNEYIETLKQIHIVEFEVNEEIKNQHYIINHRTINYGN